MTSADLSSSFTPMPIGNIGDAEEISCLLCKANVANSQLEAHWSVDHFDFTRFGCACCCFGSTYYSVAYAHAHQPGHTVVPIDNGPSNKHLVKLIDYAVACCRAAHIEALYSDLGCSNASLGAVASQTQPHCPGPALNQLAEPPRGLSLIPEAAESPPGSRQPSPTDSGIADSPGSPPAETFHFHANSSSAPTSSATTHPVLTSPLPPQVAPDVAQSAKQPVHLIISEVIGAVEMEVGNDSGGNNGILQQNGPEVAGGLPAGPTPEPVTCAVCLAEEGLQVAVAGNDEEKIQHLRDHLKRAGLSLVEGAEYWISLAALWERCFSVGATGSENQAPMEQQGIPVISETAHTEQPRFGSVKKEAAAMVAVVDFVAAGGDHSSPASAPVLSSGKSRKRSSSSSGAVCKLCSESVTVSKRGLYKHAAEHCKVFPYKCCYCYFWSLTRDHLYEHLSRHHNCTRVDVAVEYSADDKARLIATVHSCFNIKRTKIEPNVDTGTQAVEKAELSANVIKNSGQTSQEKPKHWKKQIIASTVNNEQSTSQKKSPVKRRARTSGAAGRKRNHRGNNTVKNLSISAQKSPNKRTSVSSKGFREPDIAQFQPAKRVKLASGRRAANRKSGAGGVAKKAFAQNVSQMRRPRASADNVIMQEAIDGGLLPTKKPHASVQKSSVKRRQSTPGVRKPAFSQQPCASGTSITKRAQSVAPKLPINGRLQSTPSYDAIIPKLSGAGILKQAQSVEPKLPNGPGQSTPSSNAVIPMLNGAGIVKQALAVTPKLPNISLNSSTVIPMLNGAGTVIKHVTFDKLPSMDPLISPNSISVREALHGNANIPPTLGNNICGNVPKARPYECSKCPTLHLGHFDDLANHVLTHFILPQPHHCWFCGDAPDDPSMLDLHMRQRHAIALETFLKDRPEKIARSFKSAFKQCFPRFVARLAEADFLELAQAHLCPEAVVQPAAVGKPDSTGPQGLDGPPGTSGPSTSKLG